MRFAKKCIFAAVIASLFVGTTTFCCSSLTPLAVSSETARVIDTTYKNLMRFSKALDVQHEELIACGIDSNKIRIINLESILNAILPGQPSYVDYYLRMRHSKRLFADALDKFLHSDKTLFAAAEQVFCPGNYDFDKWKSVSPESESAKSYMNYVCATFLTAYRQSQKYKERLVTFLAILEWRRKSDPEFRVYFTKGDRIEERINEHALNLCLKHSNDENYKPNGYSFTLPIPGEETYPNKLTVIKQKDAMDDAFVCMHELGHGVHNLLDINIPTQVPFAWIAENPFMKGLFFSLLSKVEEHIDTYVALIKNPESQAKLLENLSENQSENSDAQTISVDSKQYYERCLQIVENNCREAWISLEGMEIEEIKKLLSAEEFVADDAFLKKFGMLMTQYISFSPWTRPEELWQIMGTLAFKENIFLMDSDFDAKISLVQRIRWFHVIEMERSDECSDIGPSAPEEKFIRALFAIHGVEHDDYLRRVTADSL